MFNYECSECHGNYDPGELVGGVCLECMEKQRIAVIMQSQLNVMWQKGINL